MKIFLFLLVFALIWVPSLWATTYYVSNTNPVGSDSNNGTSSSTPWLTVNKVNMSRFSPGDSILFRRGCTWKEQIVFPSSGTAGNVITIGAYGTGSNPIISGAALISGWTNYSGNVWQAAFSTLTPTMVWFNGTMGQPKTSIGTLTSARDWFWSANVLYVYSASDPDSLYTSPGVEAPGRNYCVYLSNRSYLTVDGISATQANYGIYAHTAATIDVTGITIQNCTIYKIATCGIYIATANIDGTHGNTNTSILNNAVSYTGFHGIIFERNTHNGLISGNTIHDFGLISTGLGGHGISLYSAQDASYPYGNIIEHNTAYSGHKNAVGSEGNGIEADDRASSNIFRYNLSYSNQGGGFWCRGLNGKGQNQWYYNIAYNNGNAGFVNGGSPGNVFYNNTSYHNDIGYHIAKAVSTGSIMKNNISSQNATYEVKVDPDVTDIPLFDHNLYYRSAGGNLLYWKGTPSGLASWQTNSGQDAHSLNADPLFTNTTANNFRPLLGSPCINAGVNLGLTIDIIGGQIVGLPDVGTYEETNLSPSAPSGLHIVSIGP